MRSVLFQSTLLLAFVTCFAGCGQPRLHTVKVNEGTTSSGGGGSIELEFKMIGRALERRIRERAPKVHREFNFIAWREALERASVVGIHYPPYHDGKPVDAINYPTLSLVEVFSQRWQVLNASERERFVTHEVFGLAKMDDRGYRRTDDVLSKLETISLVNFKMITLDGPSASSLADSLNWTGARSSTLPRWMFADKKPRWFVSLSYKDRPFIHCVGASDTPVPKEITDKTPVNLESPNCLLSYEGFLHGGHTLVFLSEHRQTNEMFQELWKRLGGTDKAGFAYPSILGKLGSEGFQSEIRIRVDLRH